MRFTTPHPGALVELGGLLSVIDVQVVGHQVTVRGNDASPAEVLDHLSRLGVRVEGLRIAAPSLDDAYVHLTQKGEQR